MDSPSSRSPRSSQPAPSLSLILLLSLPSLSLSPPSLAALSLTNKEVRSVVFSELFRELKVERTLEDEEGELDDGEELTEVRGAVRRLEWLVKGSEVVCADEDEEEEEEEEEDREGSLEEWEKRGEKAVVGKLGRLISSLPSLTSLSLSSSSFHRSSSTPLSLAPVALPFNPPSLGNLSSLSLTGFSIPNDLLLDLLCSTPNLLELTLQTFSPPPSASSSSSVFPGGLIELTSSSPTPSPLPPTLPSSALSHLHTFTGLASHVRTLLPSGGQRSLRSLTVELCGGGAGAGGWEELVRDLFDGLPCREGSSGLVELSILGIEGSGGVEEGVRLVTKLGEALKGKGGLEELELGWGEGLGEVGGEVEDFLTKSLPHLSSSSSFTSLRSITLTTPEPTPSPSPQPTPTPTPLLPLSLALPDLSTLTINSTLWRFFRPPPLPSSLLDNPLVRVPTNTTTTTRPALTSSASASGSHALGLGVGLNNNKKAARRAGWRVPGCEREGEGGVSSEGED